MRARRPEPDPGRPSYLLRGECLRGSLPYLLFLTHPPVQISPGKSAAAGLPGASSKSPALNALLAHNLSQAAYRRILLDVVVVDPVNVGASILIYQSAAARVGS